jgi:hypothetical protein
MAIARFVAFGAVGKSLGIEPTGLDIRSVKPNAFHDV